MGPIRSETFPGLERYISRNVLLSSDLGGLYGFMMATNNTDQGRGTPPVFIPCGNLPDNTENGIQYTLREPGAAAQKTRGYNSVIGAQTIRGLWRTYPISW